MGTSPTLVRLCLAIAALAAVAAGVGLLWTDGGEGVAFTTLHGHTIRTYGSGLYRNDTFMVGAGYRGTDAVTLFIHIPLLLGATALHRRGSLRGGLMLTGMLSYFLYYYTSHAFGTAWNPLFPVYVALFAGTLLAFVLAFTSFDLATLPHHVHRSLPHRALAGFQIFIGALLTAVWTPAIVAGVVRGATPELVESYTTVVTWVLDLGLVVPATVLGGVLLLRRRPIGYLLTSVNVVLCVVIGLSLSAQGVSQLLHGVPLEPGEIAAFMAPFAVLTLVGAWPLTVFFRSVRPGADPAAPRPGAAPTPERAGAPTPGPASGSKRGVVA